MKQSESRGIDYTFISAYLEYDETSPTCLRWKNIVSPGRKKVGDIAGSITNGYSEVYVSGRRYLSHRVVMVLHGFDVTGMFVDHIDGDNHNNKIDNLRLVTVAGNQRNRKPNGRNKLGINGVRRISIPNGSNTKINDYFESGYYDTNGKYFRKKFSINKYGESLAKELALKFRLDAIRDINLDLDSFGYTERHYNETATSH